MRDDGASDDGVTDDGATDDGATDDGATDDGRSDDDASDDGTSDDDTSKNAGTDDGVTDDGTSDDGTTGDGTGPADEVRVWLVEREFTDKGLVTVVYATTDGESHLLRQASTNQLREVTAARDVAPDRLEPTDGDDVERYAVEATRMAGRHDPDEVV